MAEDIIQLLKKDHEEVRVFLNQLTQTTSRAESKRKNLLGKIEEELSMHTRIEEEIFYPAFKKASGKEGDKMYWEAKEEHRAVEDLVLPDLKKTGTSSKEFAGRARVLKELVEHHADEEEKEMFPKAKKLLDKNELKKMGEKARELKKEKPVYA